MSCKDEIAVTAADAGIVRRLPKLKLIKYRSKPSELIHGDKNWIVTKLEHYIFIQNIFLLSRKM